MEKIKRVICEKEFHLLLFVLFFISFSWPYLAMPELKHPGLLFYFMFLPWAVLIVILFVLSKSILVQS